MPSLKRMRLKGKSQDDELLTYNRPFSSMALLVKEIDERWRFWVYYSELNSLTMKDKFFIYIVDGLLDELGRTAVFFKINLRTGYHHIRIKEKDLYKTAFRTHHGHFNFKVMSCILTNAPAIFQALMNHVFQDRLQKCVLVFFDDILIYSLNVQEHFE